MGAMQQDARTTSVVRAGLRCRCPRCGEGLLYKAPLSLTLKDSCGSCSLSYGFADSGDGPAVFVIMILGFVILGLAVIVEFGLKPPLWVHLILWLPATLVLAFGLLRVIKALLIAQQFKHQAAEGRVAGD